MIIREPRPTTHEDMLRCTQLKLLISRRLRADTTNWNLHLSCPFWRIYVNSREGAFVKVGVHSWELLPGRVYCIPAWLEFKTEAHGELVHDYIHFEWSGMSPAWLRRSIPAPVELAIEGPLVELCRRWQESLENGHDESTLAQHVWTQAWVYAVVAAMLTRGGARVQRELLNRLAGVGRLRAALEQIDRQPSTPLSNTELAKLCGLSPDHFIKRFREAMGLTPAQYQLEQRVTQAAQWLAGGDLKIEAIAEATGFTDRFHFSRAFSARLGESPGAYRRKFRNAAVEEK